MMKRTGDARRKLGLKREQLRVLSAADVMAVVGGGWCEGLPTDTENVSAGKAQSKTCRAFF
jgi:hypothetical protein